MKRLLICLGPILSFLVAALHVRVPVTTADAETQGHRPSAPRAAHAVYLPLLQNGRYSPQVNVPYLDAANISSEQMSEMGIFWLGRVTPTENYADVRIAYSATALELRVAVFDRLLWYDSTPAAASLAQWDAVTVYLNLGGGAGLSSQAYAFDSQLTWWEPNRTNWQAAYRGNGTTWSAASVPFTTTAAWRGDSPNNNGEDRGWVTVLRVPFASLGLTTAPAPGTQWGLGIAVHDRDDAAGTAIPAQKWPEPMDSIQPTTWGQLHFGLPTYTLPPVAGPQTVTIREGLAGASVPDTAVGGTTGNLCPGNSYHIWNEWGNRSYGTAADASIQNQGDIADWPCYAKYFVTFPLEAVPAGQAVVSATLTLHHWGNSGSASPGQWNSAQASYMHVLTVPGGWNENTLTWNNAPQALENVSQAWVPVNAQCFTTLSWPCLPRSWDVSYAVAKALATGRTISFALYSSDAAYHSGKFFTSSDVEDWNAVGRPTLRVTWGTP